MSDVLMVMKLNWPEASTGVRTLPSFASYHAKAPDSDFPEGVENYAPYLRSTPAREMADELVEQLRDALQLIDGMNERAFLVGLEGTSSWDKVAAGGPERLHDVAENLRETLRKVEGEKEPDRFEQWLAQRRPITEWPTNTNEEEGET